MNFIKGANQYTWDHEKWLKQFKAASKIKDGFRELRKSVFKSTVEIVKNTFYYYDESEMIELHPYPQLLNETVLYTKPGQLDQKQRFDKTDIIVKNIDTLDAALELMTSGLNPAALNMANRQNPGGGVINGAGAQEENIFRRSNLFSSLYQFADYAEKYGIKKNKTHRYPLRRESGGVYSPRVTVFRGNENKGYPLLEKPYQVSIVSVPAINSPELESLNGEYRIISKLVEPSKEKIRAILRIAAMHQHDSLVLGAFGCGAFKNPPEHMAELFHEVLLEKEFLNKFKVIMFAILSDHHSGKSHSPHGNFIPFQKIFANGRI